MLLVREIKIKRPISDVFQYVSNFSNLFEWDDHVTEGHRMDLGPIKVGSCFLFQYSLVGRSQTLKYTLLNIERDKRLYFSCTASNFTALDEILFENTPDGTKITYKARIELESKITDYLFQPIMARIADGVVSRLKTVLEKNTQKIKDFNSQEKTFNILNIPYRFTTPGWNQQRKKFTATEDRKKKILITGPTSGLGYSTTLTLAGKGCDLVLVARDTLRLEKLIGELKDKGFNGEVETYACDMQEIAQVTQTCTQIRKDGHQFDAIINNAGALFSEEKLINGIERTTVVDLVAPWIFSTHLSDQLIEKSGCLINISSGGMYSTPLNIDKLKKSPSPFSGSKAYAFAKRGMVVFSSGLNKELEPKGVRVHCMHPGWADTPGVLNSLPGFHRLTKKFLRTPFQGADTIVWLAMCNPTTGGKFWLDREIQPIHILRSTQERSEDYNKLKIFLETFSKI